MMHLVKNLEGAVLDAAVAQAEGRALLFEIRGEPSECYVDGVLYQPSTDWSVGGPLIVRERITLLGYPRKLGWTAYVRSDFGGSEDYCQNWDAEGEGSTPLIAAMRAYVASKFGKDVDLV